MSFYFHSEYRSVGYDSTVFKLHSHDHIEILQPWTNGGNYLINRSLFPITAGHIYIVDGLSVHCSKPEPPSSYIRSKIFISRDTFISLAEMFSLTQIFSDLFENGVAVFGTSEKGALSLEADSCFKKCSESLSIGNSTDAMLSLTSLLSSLRSVHREDNTPTYDPVYDLLMHVSRSVDSGGHLSLDELAEKMNISKFRLCHMFKEKTGGSIMRYAAILRLAKAEHLLTSTDMTITQISDTLGYANSSAFAKTFRQIKGITPSEYRNSKACAGNDQ